MALGIVGWGLLATAAVVAAAAAFADKNTPAGGKPPPPAPDRYSVVHGFSSPVAFSTVQVGDFVVVTLRDRDTGKDVPYPLRVAAIAPDGLDAVSDSTILAKVPGGAAIALPGLPDNTHFAVLPPDILIDKHPGSDVGGGAIPPPPGGLADYTLTSEDVAAGPKAFAMTFGLPDVESLVVLQGGGMSIVIRGDTVSAGDFDEPSPLNPAVTLRLAVRPWAPGQTVKVPASSPADKLVKSAVGPVATAFGGMGWAATPYGGSHSYGGAGWG